MEIVPHTNAPTSAGTDQAWTQCPAGKSLIGAGGKIDNGSGQVDLGTFTNSSGPFLFGSAAFAKEDADGFAGTYTVTGYSICARANGSVISSSSRPPAARPITRPTSRARPGSASSASAAAPRCRAHTCNA